jgi:replicative DNA helicase
MNSAAVVPFSRATEERLPPQNIEAEESVLGALLFQSDCFDRVVEVLQPQHFYISAHQEIYRELLGMYSRDEVIDLITASRHLEAIGKLDRVGGRSKLAMLHERCLSTVNVDLHAKIIAKLFRFREMIRVGNELVQLGYQADDLEEALNLADAKVHQLCTQQEAAEDEMIGGLATRWYAQLEERINGESVAATPTDFYDLDAMTNGLMSGRLTILMGRPGQGKTALALNILKNAARLSRKTAAFFSLEMPEEDIFTRLVSTEAQINSKQIESGNVPPPELERILVSLDRITSLPLYVTDRFSTIEIIRAKARKLAREENGLSVLIIDHLQYMLQSSDDPTRDSGKITKGLVALARELKIHVILLQQLNRNVETRNDKRPLMSDGRQSGLVEEDAHHIWALYRDEYYNPETTDRGIAELINLKNRSGETGTVRLLFEPQFGRFRNLAQSSRPEWSDRLQSRPQPAPALVEEITVPVEVTVLGEEDTAPLPLSDEEINAALFEDDEDF